MRNFLCLLPVFFALSAADHLIVMDAGPSRTTAYLFSFDPHAATAPVQVAKAVNSNAGQDGLHQVVTTDNVAINQHYFSPMLAELSGKVVAGSAPITVSIFGTGGVRSVKDKDLLWQRVRTALDQLLSQPAFAMYTLAETRTLDGATEEASLGLLVARLLTSRPAETALIEIGGSSSQVAFGDLTESFAGFGAVSASETFNKMLMGENAAVYDAAVRNIFPARSTKKTAKTTVAIETAEGGRLSTWANSINHPCLLRANNWNNVISAYDMFKNPDSTCFNVVPFQGTGDYNKCYKAIVDQIGTHVRHIPAGFAVVGTGILFFNHENLKKTGLVSSNTPMATVGDVVRLARQVCAMEFADAYKQFNVMESKESISPHGLVELCWASAYSAAMLTHFHGLTDDQPLTLTNVGWAAGMAIKIAKSLRRGSLKRKFDTGWRKH